FQPERQVAEAGRNDVDTKPKRKLLVVDDDKGLSRQLRWAFDDCEVLLAGERREAFAELKKEKPSVVLLDLGLPPDPHGPTEGLATLEGILSLAPETKVIVMSGQTQREYAVQAVARGAYDFYQKPIEIETLSLIVRRAFHLFSLEDENRTLARSAAKMPLPGLVTANPKMLEICQQLRRFAPSDVTILLLGESGTGKELFARAAHSLSKRAQKPFVAINCAAIPEHLLESELFGHEKGAFTGAVKTTPGKVEMAAGGTLFLDEIGDLPISLQAKLFRFVQERVIERVGGRRQIAVDLRIVCATNQELPKLISSGVFREELYWRLAEATIQIPPLRERPDDAVVLAHHLLRQLAAEQGRSIRGFAPEALAAISSYGWPGNVRELENRIKRAVVAAQSSSVQLRDLDLASGQENVSIMTLKQSRNKAERHAITQAMIESQGNVSRAAKLLEISRPTLYQLMREHDLK
ncbi:MAG TPA: PEP-CTERM-box response regulator transcription factor, partial [Candidatus Limnocylindria bacterium]|nr:PEP-CTERM-box response regulator transcription factor [Candidatus Limnocylindria bacterium]